MARFNQPTPEPPAPTKARVCLFVNPDTYTQLKAQCVMDRTNVSRWFDDMASVYLTGKVKLTSQVQRKVRGLRPAVPV